MVRMNWLMASEFDFRICVLGFAAWAIIVIAVLSYRVSELTVKLHSLDRRTR